MIAVELHIKVPQELRNDKAGFQECHPISHQQENLGTSTPKLTVCPGSSSVLMKSVNPDCDSTGKDKEGHGL
jgi:hypothetical protein